LLNGKVHFPLLFSLAVFRLSFPLPPFIVPKCCRPSVSSNKRNNPRLIVRPLRVLLQDRRSFLVISNTNVLSLSLLCLSYVLASDYLRSLVIRLLLVCCRTG